MSKALLAGGEGELCVAPLGVFSTQSSRARLTGRGSPSPVTTGRYQPTGPHLRDFPLGG
jgi:hypothetical protein